jgi:CRP-like cAMP-binding protein
MTSPQRIPITVLHSITVHAKALTDIRQNLEDAIRLAWQQRVPNSAIAEAAGYTDEAAVRMLAKRRGWKR